MLVVSVAIKLVCILELKIVSFSGAVMHFCLASYKGIQYFKTVRKQLHEQQQHISCYSLCARKKFSS